MAGIKLKNYFNTLIFGFFLTSLALNLMNESAHAQFTRSLGIKPNRAFVYTGKLVRPGGQTPNGSMAVTIRVLSPDPSLCILWAETQTVTVENGGFAIGFIMFGLLK